MHLSFHTILFLAYTIPNVYVFLRILKLITSRKSRVWYVVIYLLVALIYPAGNFVPERSGLASMLELISDYLLPFYLYLFLSLLISDLLLFLNWIFRIIPGEKIKSRSFRRIHLLTVLVISLVIVIGGIINFNTIRISEFRIDIPAGKSELKHLRIAFVADFHLQERTGINFVSRFGEKIKSISPDILIFGGDIIEGDGDDGNVQKYESILREIKTRYGVYSVLGNHEFYAGLAKGSFFTRSGMKLLIDTSVVFKNSFTLTGRYDSHFTGRKSVRDLLNSVPDSLPQILIDHRPTEIDEVSSAMADIQLSGHTHNGQLFPINLITRRVYQLSWGHMKKGNTHFFVTSGIRLWGPPVRTTGKSEIMVIDIDFTAG